MYGVVSLVLVAGALTFALSSPPPSTPPLAEVAPAPQENIELERVEQSSRFGEGGAGDEGECAVGDAGCEGVGEHPAEQTSGGAPDEVVERRAAGGLRRCSHGPGGPRQTDDPQSPPCVVEIFQGDNGGATAPGVTAHEIRVAVPRWPNEDADANTAQEVLAPALVHVHDEYELYGRRIELVPVRMPEGNLSDPSYQRAFAREVVAADVFASLHYPGFGAFQEELAHSSVVSLSTTTADERALTRLHPYAWSVYPSTEERYQATAELICKSLDGRPAQHGGPGVRELARRFGVVEERGAPGAEVGVELLRRRLEACGADARFYAHEAGDDLGVLVQRIRADGVTTVVCACSSLRKTYLEEAEAQEYEPEWLIAATDHQSLYLFQARRHTSEVYPRRQLAHVFGLSVSLRRPTLDANTGAARMDEQYWFHAAREGDPGFQPSDQLWTDNYYGYYAQLLVLASGAQWAGPELTPQAFGAALAGLSFPNPGVGAPPWWQPSVGFGPTDHGFNSDVALVWWRDPDDAGYRSRTDVGELCYVGGGTRYRVGRIPAEADQLFFDPDAGCR